MEFIDDLGRLSDTLRGGALAIGNFDGVHRGHVHIVERLVAMAKEVGGPSVIFTFDPHPAAILRPGDIPPPLCWTPRKAELLGQLGVEVVVAYPTDRKFLELSAEAFFRQVVVDQLGAKAMVEGPNFFFGHDREGDVALLDRFCRQAGVLLEIVEPMETEGQLISSSRIRSLVAEGDVDAAREMLTEPYRIRGMVVHGAHRGRELGFPTANLGAIDTLLPGEGIFAGRAWIDGSPLPAAISLGPNPTFDEGRLKVEVHILDFEGSLYDRPLEVDFLGKLRKIEKFTSVEALIEQMNRDLDRTREIYNAVAL